MTNKPEFCMTREKHLDHMTRVVPFIVAAYAIQCFFIMKMGPIAFAADALFFMGVCLMAMILCFVTYDLTHTVTFQEESLTIKVKWLNYQRTISYQELAMIEISEAGVSFATIRLATKKGKNYGFYFVDDADKIKAWLEKKRTPEFQAAA